ncbi:DUF1232 domain-containing protein [Akkermansiaceae bacterium]|nr:DUF1232 domain-containing protein [Akkermansiaceae bacterium]
MNDLKSTTSEEKDYSNEFSEMRFWAKLKENSGSLGNQLIYQVLCMYYQLLDREIAIPQKLLIMSALGYWILPLDLIPDYVLGVGYTDDIPVLTAAFLKVQNEINTKKRVKAIKRADLIEKRKTSYS